MKADIRLLEAQLFLLDFVILLSGSHISTVIFLPARPGSQTHASHKGRMILNHESPAGCIKIVAKSLHLVFATFVLSVFF